MTSMKGSDVSQAAFIAASAITPETDSVRLIIDITNVRFGASKAVQAVLLFLTNLLTGAEQPVVSIRLESFHPNSTLVTTLWPPGFAEAGSIRTLERTEPKPVPGVVESSSKSKQICVIKDCSCWECGGPGWD